MMPAVHVVLVRFNRRKPVATSVGCIFARARRLCYNSGRAVEKTLKGAVFAARFQSESDLSISPRWSKRMSRFRR